MQEIMKTPQISDEKGILNIHNLFNLFKRPK